MSGRLGTTALVALRELRQQSRSRSFRIATLVLVLGVAAGVLVPAALKGRDQAQKVGVVGGGTEALFTVRTAERISGKRVETVVYPDLAAAEAGLRDGQVAAVVVPGREVLVARTPYAGAAADATSLSGALALAGGLADDRGAVAAPTPSPSLPVRGLSPPLTDLRMRLTGLAASIVVYVIIVVYGAWITTGVTEEKTSRVVEVLLAAVTPAQLLLGKVLGIGVIALSQALAVIATFVALTTAVGSDLLHAASLQVVAVGALWMVVGYAFYCTLYAAAGSLASKPSEASNAAGPVGLPLILAYFVTFAVLYGDTVPGWFWFFAFFPPTAPVSMTVLVAMGAAQPWQVALSVLLCVASTALTAWVAVRIYRRGIVHTGSRLGWRQAFRG